MLYTLAMADQGLVTYAQRDVRSNTSLRVCGARAFGPGGTLVHTTSGVDSLEWLQGGSASAGTPASADFLIAREGTQYNITPAGRYAYHAGQSIYTLDRPYRNDEVSQKLLGVELEALDNQQITFQQYDSLAQLIVEQAQVWAWRWPFIILGHYAVARPLGRRSDPVNFDWGWLMGRLFVRSASVKLPGLE